MKQETITGRDGFIIKQALYYAIKYINDLPEYLREYSNQMDMARILNAYDPDYVDREKTYYGSNGRKLLEQLREKHPEATPDPVHDDAIGHYRETASVEEVMSEALAS